MAIVLMDEGTLDTVLRCTECGEEFRASYADEAFDGSYEEWREQLFADVEDTHLAACDGPDEVAA